MEIKKCKDRLKLHLHRLRNGCLEASKELTNPCVYSVASVQTCYTLKLKYILSKLGRDSCSQEKQIVQGMN